MELSYSMHLSKTKKKNQKNETRKKKKEKKTTPQNSKEQEAKQEKENTCILLNNYTVHRTKKRLLDSEFLFRYLLTQLTNDYLNYYLSEGKR